jgi:hypothetical protein
VRRWQGGKIDEPFNIIIEPGTSLNELYTAIGRTTKWEHIGIDSKWGTSPPLQTPGAPHHAPKAGEHEGGLAPHRYERTAYTLKCRKSELVETVSKGFIYEWRTKDGVPFYIGRTRDIKEREREHRESPTNPEMDIMMKDPTHVMVPVEEWMCTTRQLDERETLCIRRAQHAGVKLHNVKKMSDEVVPMIKQTIILDAPKSDRFQPVWDEKRGTFRIRYTDHEGKKRTIERSGRRDKESALREMEASRKQLEREYYGLRAKDIFQDE